MLFLIMGSVLAGYMPLWLTRFMPTVAQRQKLWEKLTSDPDVAAKCQILESKSDEEKLHSMLNEEFWVVDVDEESGLVYGPFKHAFKCIAKYVSDAWKIRNAYAHPSDVA